MGFLSFLFLLWLISVVIAFLHFFLNGLIYSREDKFLVVFIGSIILATLWFPIWVVGTKRVVELLENPPEKIKKLFEEKPSAN